MELQQIIKIAIYIHAAFGGLALIFGLFAMIARKGNKNHKKTGSLFYYSMTISALISLIIAVLPNHENPFLFTIGIFTLYLVLTGKMALNYKKTEFNLVKDKAISILMIITGIGMIFFPIFKYQSFNIVLMIFGSLGIILAVNDLLKYRNHQLLRKKWLTLHLTKMIGAYISSITAFIVVTQIIPGIYGWLLPGFLGSFVITYWVRKVSRS